MGYLSTVIGHPTDGSPVSGGGLSQNGKFSYGYASCPGKRASMEDFYETRIDCVDGQIVGLFGVFDGHGGAKVAEYVKQNIFSHLLRHPKFISDTKVAIDDAYKSTDSELLESDNIQNQCGSTASTAVLVGDRLFVANVGDSRAIICRGGNGNLPERLLAYLEFLMQGTGTGSSYVGSQPDDGAVDGNADVNDRDNNSGDIDGDTNHAAIP